MDIIQMTKGFDSITFDDKKKGYFAKAPHISGGIPVIVYEINFGDIEVQMLLGYLPKEEKPWFLTIYSDEEQFIAKNENHMLDDVTGERESLSMYSTTIESIVDTLWNQFNYRISKGPLNELIEHIIKG